MIEGRLAEFAVLLRQNGLRVSPGELGDAASALGLMGLGDREITRAVLRSTLVKRAREVPVFDRLFALYFGGFSALLAGFEQSLLAQMRQNGLFEPDSLAMLAHELSHRSLTPLGVALIDGDRAQLAQLLRGAALQLDLGQITNAWQSGYFVRRMLAAAGISEAARELQPRLRARFACPGA